MKNQLIDAILLFLFGGLSIISKLLAEHQIISNKLGFTLMIVFMIALIIKVIRIRNSMKNLN